MNLCGGIVNVSEPELLLLEIPDEKFSLTPRRKASSSTPSRRRKGVPTHVDTSRRTPTGTSRTPSFRPSSRGKPTHLSTPTGSPSPTFLNPIASPSPTFLNPISKEDLKKRPSRQRPLGPSSLRGLKTPSGLVKKLEEGFKVVSTTRFLYDRCVLL
jgi:hypothetical protein